MGLPAGSLGSMDATWPVPLRGALHLAEGMHSLHGKQGSYPRGERLEWDKIKAESDLTRWWKLRGSMKAAGELWIRRLHALSFT